MNSATTSLPSLTTIAIITMTQKTTTIAAAAILLIGAGTAAFIYKSEPEAPPAVPSRSAAAGKSTSSLGNAESGEENTRSKRTREAGENAELIAKYGESRTNLAKHIASNVITLLDDVIGMGDLVATGGLAEAFGGNQAALRRALGKLGGELQLTDEQRETSAALYADFQKREMDKAKASVASLKKDPSSLMQAMLASDAYARGEISEAEFKQAQASSTTDLKGVMNPLESADRWGGQPLKDETFSHDFLALLDPTQAAVYQKAAAAEEAKPEEQADNGNISNLPPMELEKLDSTITSAQKMTGGIKQMMEGMGGLKDLGPLLQQPGGQGAAPGGN